MGCTIARILLAELYLEIDREEIRGGKEFNREAKSRCFDGQRFRFRSDAGGREAARLLRGCVRDPHHVGAPDTRQNGRIRRYCAATWAWSDHLRRGGCSTSRGRDRRKHYLTGHRYSH